MASGVSWGGSVAGVGCTRVPARTPGRRGRPPRWSLPVGTGVAVHKGGCQQCPSVPDAAHDSLRWRVRRRLQTSAQNGSKGSVLPSPRQPEPKVSAAALQPLRPAPLFVTPWTAARQASVPLTSSQSLPKLMHVHRVGDAIQPSHRLLPSSPFAFNLSQPRALAAVL